MKTMLLLCALIAGSSSVWAEDVKVIDEDFNAGTASGWTLDGKTSFQGSAGAKSLQIASSKGDGTAMTPAFSSLVGTTATLTFSISSANSNVNTLTITGNSCKVDGETSTTASTDEGTVTIAITEASTTSTITFSASKNAGCKIDDVVVSYTSGGDPTTYTVTYNGNGATSGTAPTDSYSPYESGATVTVLDNTGSLAKTGYSFGGWNTKSNGTGTNYSAGATFSITANTILYAKWNFVVTDGIFDFVKAASAGEDYGSGVPLSSSDYTTGSNTWKAGNVTMVTTDGGGSGLRWWSADGTLRFYNKATATFSVPSGYVITKIVTTGANFNSADVGTLSSSTWTGASNSVELSVNDTRNIKTITITYTTANQSITPSHAKITYVTPQKMDFSDVDGLKAYVATAADGNGVTMTRVEAPVPANTPLLLIGTASTTYNVPVVASATAPATNYLEKGDGTTDMSGVTGYNYILFSDGKFYQVTSGTVATTKAYLHLESNPAGARSLNLVFDDGETTGISDALRLNDKGQMTNDSYFDLQGRRIAQPTKGLYIVNGKKVVIK